MKYIFLDDKNQYSYFIDKTEQVSSTTRKLEISKSSSGSDKHTYFLRRLAGELFISKDGQKWTKTAALPLRPPVIYLDQNLELFRGFIPSGKQGQVGGALKTKMPGKVVKVLVKEGQSVAAGESLLILEAMKMENEFKSPAPGVVKKIYVSEGMALETGFLMIELEDN